MSYVKTIYFNYNTPSLLPFTCPLDLVTCLPINVMSLLKSIIFIFNRVYVSIGIGVGTCECKCHQNPEEMSKPLGLEL